jgi:hypothetical protein
MAETLRDNFWVFPVVPREWTCRADRTFKIGMGYITLQECRICDFHLV